MILLPPDQDPVENVTMLTSIPDFDIRATDLFVNQARSVPLLTLGDDDDDCADDDDNDDLYSSWVPSVHRPRQSSGPLLDQEQNPDTRRPDDVSRLYLQHWQPHTLHDGHQ